MMTEMCVVKGLRKKQSRVIAVQMDAFSALNPENDSTLLMGLVLQEKGYELFFYEVQNLSVRNGQVVALGVFATLQRSENFYVVREEALVDLGTVLLVMVRQDPPFDMTYLTATYILDLIKNETLVLNNPTSIRDLPEKFSPLLFKDSLPNFLVTASKKMIQEFAAQYQSVVLKPIYQHGGRDVVKVSASERDFDMTVEEHLEKFRYVIVQEFISDVVLVGDKRVLFAGGEVIGAFSRIPRPGDFRSNTVLGSSVAACELSARELQICSIVGELLKERGLVFVGIDLLSEMLIEINATSPTGLAALNALYGGRHEEKVIDIIETKIDHRYTVS